MTHITAHAIQQRYWDIANDPQERGYVKVRALDSLSKMLGLFEFGKRKAQQLVEAAVSKAEGAVSEIQARYEQMVAEGVDFADFSMLRKKDDDEQDEEDGKADDEEPP